MLSAGAVLAALAVAPAPAAAGSGKWIVDEAAGCGTSNPYFTPGERIRWHGRCADGKLDGRGTLIWYQDDRETERNEGTFRGGEFHGDVVTTYADGQVVHGQYVDGVRHGAFVIVRLDGQHIRAVYEDGALRSQALMTAAEAAQWKSQVAARPEPRTPAPVAGASRQAAAARPQAAPAERSDAPQKKGWFDKMLGWVGLGDDEPRPAKAAPAAAAPAASAPAPAFPSPTPRAPAAVAAPTAAAPAARASPAVMPVPPEVPRRPVTIVVAEPFGGDMYDMAVFLAERHPFNDLPTARAAMPILVDPEPPGQRPETGQPFRVTEDSSVRVLVDPTAPSALLASGWPRGLPGAPPQGSAAAVGAVIAPPPPAPDSLFKAAYQMERAGQLFEAEQLYERLLMHHPSAPAAQLANSRLGELRQARRQDVRDSVQEASLASATGQAEQIPAGPASRVVAVNSAVPPVDPASPAARTSRATALNYATPELHRRACTREGLYEDGARWCGAIRRDEGRFYRIEVEDVRLPRFGTIGISRSPCTGNTFLNWFSRGSLVRVPKECMEFEG